ncbi:hypothetical protein ACFQS1_21785 [Paractinoplanes rhizophilus]|jgi:hypothetical protein|uniref:Uncharacterized protein n=1 Tax=Paractinoplanes rhizophilus TaxID=1416877 RepID=A0ABW2HVV9_9ACTN|nr:hypothetical protein [Actinoplanes sp.]
MTAVAETDVLRGRKARIRQRELLLTLEQWGPAYRNVAGERLHYVFEIAEATEEERAWLREHIAKNGMPESGRSAEEMRAAGGRANASASAAFLAGDYERARDLIDEARAYGALFEAEWERLHEFISTKLSGAGDPSGVDDVSGVGSAPAAGVEKGSRAE